MGDKQVVKCRTCSGDHWTSKCPWKDTVLAGGKADDKKTVGSTPGKFSYFVIFYSLDFRMINN